MATIKDIVKKSKPGNLGLSRPQIGCNLPVGEATQLIHR